MTFDELWNHVNDIVDTEGSLELDGYSSDGEIESNRKVYYEAKTALEKIGVTFWDVGK